MRFSVVIPVYNKALYVGDTLRSVLAQSLEDFEVLVVDDGSTDGSYEIATAIHDPRVHVFRQSHFGVSAARNAGVARAEGEWVAFLDADDWLHPVYLATQWATATANSNVDVVATDYWIPEPGCWKPRVWSLPDGPPPVEIISDLPKRWRLGRALSASSVAVRRFTLLAQRIWFPAGESYGEDLDLWFRLAERSLIALAHIELVAYRKGLPGSLASHESTSSAVPPFLTRLERRVLAGVTPERLRGSTLRLVDEYRVSLARMAIERGCRAEALPLLRQAARVAHHHRWWVTALMVLAAPRHLVSRWQRWRLNRNPAFQNRSVMLQK